MTPHGHLNRKRLPFLPQSILYTLLQLSHYDLRIITSDFNGEWSGLGNVIPNIYTDGIILNMKKLHGIFQAFGINSGAHK